MAQTTYMQMLLKQMAEKPDSVALRDAAHPAGITYRELDDRSGRVYAWLKQKGIGREQMIMVNLPRGLEIFIAAIGVLRAGAAYTITATGYPEERVAFIEKDCGCVLRISPELYGEMMDCSPAAGMPCESMKSTRSAETRRVVCSFSSRPVQTSSFREPST